MVVVQGPLVPLVNTSKTKAPLIGMFTYGPALFWMVNIAPHTDMQYILFMQMTYPFLPCSELEGVEPCIWLVPGIPLSESSEP